MTNQELFDELERRGENDRFFVPLDDPLPETEIVANDEPDFEEYEVFVYDSERDGRRINLQEEK